MKHNRRTAWIAVWCILVAAIIAWPGQVVYAGSDEPAPQTETQTEQQTEKRWIGVDASYGRHEHIWSDREYFGYSNSQFGIYYEWLTEPWFTFGPKIDHTYKIVFRYADLRGTIPLSDDQVSDEEAAATDEHYTTLDHKQAVFLGIRRWVFLPDYWIHPNLHLGCGLSVTDKLIIEGGTYYAFSFTGGGGVDIDLNDRWTIFTEASWEHFSNGGQMYLTNKKVIGPESLNTRFGIRYRF